MIRIELNDTQRDELKKYRSSAKSKNAERALMVLMNADGASPPQIAAQLKRHEHTVRDWLRRYQAHGLSGLNRRYAPGRSRQLREDVGQALEEAMLYPPSHFKYAVSLWTARLLVDWLATHKSIQASEDTVERALKERGYRYHRTAKRVPEHAPSKEEKQVSINKMIDEIKCAIDSQKCEILALDESHFSTEPYVQSGWQKKLWPPADPNPKKEGTTHRIWRLEFGDKKILLEERRTR